MERYASDVLENWTPDLPDAHPDDVERTYDDDGAPILRCPMVPASTVYTMMVGRTNGRPVLREVVKFDGARVSKELESGAIEGAGGTWWVPKSSAWSVEPSRIRALSPRGRAWLKATHARLSHYTLPGETDQRTAPLHRAIQTCKPSGGWRTESDPRIRWTRPMRCPWVGIDATTGEVVLSLACDEARARAIVEGYSIAGRPLTLRPA